MTRYHFPLFQSHLDLAHSYWSRVLQPGDRAIDATCGNGWDTLALAKLLLNSDGGEIYAFDVQAAAVESTKQLLKQELAEDVQNRIQVIHESHANFPSWMLPHSIKLIIYNLGYLPGSSKIVTTQTETTLASLQRALTLLQTGGAISMTCYPGHPEGANEELHLLKFAETLDPREWSCCHHRWINRRQSPSLLWIQKKD